MIGEDVYDSDLGGYYVEMGMFQEFLWNLKGGGKCKVLFYNVVNDVFVEIGFINYFELI